jgi:hypothetical protein
MQYLDKTLETYVWNTWNTWNIDLQHAFIVTATYATSQIYFCSIQMEHLKHKSEMPETLETQNVAGGHDLPMWNYS